MSVIREIHQRTLEISKFVKNTGAIEDRDLFVDKVLSMIEERQNLVNQMKPPYSDEERVLGEEISSLDKEINQKLNNVLKAIKSDIGGLKKRKMTQSRYENPYESAYSDGTFLDKRN